MSEHENEEGGLAVPGPESHESEETLGRDERGAQDAPLPPPSEPTTPGSPAQPSLWDRIMGKLKSRG